MYYLTATRRAVALIPRHSIPLATLSLDHLACLSDDLATGQCILSRHDVIT